MGERVKGFSKLSKEGKIEWLLNAYFNGNEDVLDLLKGYWHLDPKVQKLHDEFIENTISNFYIPFGVAPNFKINGKDYCIPFAIEESSVVAASAKAAAFWYDRGGFKSEVLSTRKIGHVHFTWTADPQKVRTFFYDIKDKLISGTDDLTANMQQRGGGIIDVELIDKTDEEPNYFQLKGIFETKDAMGANFINSILERWSQIWKDEAEHSDHFSAQEKEELMIIMCILSNYTPECIVRTEVSCKVGELFNNKSEFPAELFAEKFMQAIRIATIEPYRATTHNKGIMNGIDAVVIATGNDFRAVEACAHTYASRDGQYRSLTQCEVKDGVFRFWIEIPMSLGTVGGITTLHPMVKFAHELLGKPDARELMQVISCAGLAQNFGAVASLVTTGIQKGHMKMHLMNIMNQLEANTEEKKQIKDYFADKVVSFSEVENYFKTLRGENVPKKK
ncbi:MAG: hydroxymethylglutaryl-CoA reductase, degradative [Flavobacteriales bacterium]|nr:hydroxymethylglutaryl-CoA reductase, degradative [Flavobacteriales bacterium]